MKAKIAVVTVSGKAYYLLVSELKEKNTPFLSLTPDDTIPVDVKVVITTKKEHPRISHENVLEYEEDRNPSEVVDEAIRIIKGKRIYESLIVGVDPGQNFGVAVLGDGKVLEAKSCMSVNETANAIRDFINQTPANHVTLRVGDGAPSYTEELLCNLANTLPENVAIESVREEGTSKSLGDSHRRGKRDANAAIKIGQMQGLILPRRKRDD